MKLYYHAGLRRLSEDPADAGYAKVRGGWAEPRTQVPGLRVFDGYRPGRPYKLADLLTGERSEWRLPLPGYDAPAYRAYWIEGTIYAIDIADVDSAIRSPRPERKGSMQQVVYGPTPTDPNEFIATVSICGYGSKRPDPDAAPVRMLRRALRASPWESAERTPDEPRNIYEAAGFYLYEGGTLIQLRRNNAYGWHPWDIACDFRQQRLTPRELAGIKARAAQDGIIICCDDPEPDFEQFDDVIGNAGVIREIDGKLAVFREDAGDRLLVAYPSGMGTALEYAYGPTPTEGAFWGRPSWLKLEDELDSVQISPPEVEATQSGEQS